MATFQDGPILDFCHGHKREQSQDSGAYIDWNSEDSASPTGNGDGNGEFVTVVAVESDGFKPKSPFVTVLAIGEEKPKDFDDVIEEVLVYRLPGERLGFGLKFEGGTNTAENVKRLFIQSSAPDSPASRAECSWGSLVEGDEIIKIDDRQVNEMTRLDCVRCLKESNVVIKLHVRHPGKEIKSEPEPIPVPSTTPTVICAEMKKRTPPPPPIPPRKIPRKSPAPLPKEEILPPEGFADWEKANGPVPKTRTVPSDPKTAIRLPQKTKLDSPRTIKRTNLDFCHVPPEPEVYLDLLAQEDIRNNCESESDDTGSTISTVVGFSSMPTTTNSSFSDLRSSASSVCDSTTPSTPTSTPTTPVLDLSKILSPYENSDYLFTKLISDKEHDNDEKTSTCSDDVVPLQPPLSFQDAPLSYGNEEVRATLTEDVQDEVFLSSLKNYPEDSLDEVDLNENDHKNKESPKSTPNKKSSLIPRLAKSMGLLSPPKPSPRKDVNDGGKSRNKKRPPPPPPPRSDRPQCPKPEATENKSLKSSIPYLKKKKSKHDEEKKSKKQKNSKSEEKVIERCQSPRFNETASKCLEPEENVENDQKLCWPVPELKVVCDSDAKISEDLIPGVEGADLEEFLSDSGSAEFGVEAITSREPYFLFQWSGSKHLETIGEDEEEVSNEEMCDVREEREVEIPETVVPETIVVQEEDQPVVAEEKPEEIEVVNNAEEENLERDSEEKVDEEEKGEMNKTMVPVVPTTIGLAPPPSFSRMPPDGHEFPQNFQEDSVITMPAKIKTDQIYSEDFMKADVPPLPMTEPPPSKFSFRHDGTFEILPSKRFGEHPGAKPSRTSQWRQDEKSGKSVRDKIAMFSSVPDQPVSPANVNNNNNNFFSGKLNKYKSSEDVFYDDEADCIRDLKTFSKSVVSVDKIGRKNPYGESNATPRSLDFSTRTQSTTDLTSCSSSAYSSSCSPDSSLSSTTSSYLGYSSTLPRKNNQTKNDLKSNGVTRATSFSAHGRSQSLLDVQSPYRFKSDVSPEDDKHSSLHLLVEQRRKNMSKLRGLVIPEKLTETRPIFDLPEIKSRDSILATTLSYRDDNKLNSNSHFKGGGYTQQAQTNLISPPWKNQKNIPKYSPAFKRKSISVYGKESPPSKPPSKPPRTKLLEPLDFIIDRSRVVSSSTDLYGRAGRSEDDSDNDSAVSSSRSSISHGFSPPASPLLDSSHRPVTRTLSSETTASGGSNASTLTSGSSSSDGNNKRILKPQSVEAINRKNVLTSAKYSRGFDAKSGSPLIQRKHVTDRNEEDEESYESYARRYSNETISYKLADSYVTSGSKPTDVKIAFLNNVDTTDYGKKKVEKTESSPCISTTNVLPSPAPRRTSVPFASPYEEDKKSPLTPKTSTESLRSRASSVDTIVENYVPDSRKGSGVTDSVELYARLQTAQMKIPDKNRRSVSVNDIRKAFEKAEANLAANNVRSYNSKTSVPYGADGNHVRVSSLDSTASEDSCALTSNHYGSSSNLQREQFGSITSLASSTSLISPQELQLLIEEANQTLEESGGNGGGSSAVSHDVLVVILHRDSAGGSVGITLAGGADYESKEITVHKVLAGSPADRDGRIQKGDRILSINGKSMKGCTHRESLAILKSPRPEVVLVVSRVKSETNGESVSTDDSLVTSLRSSLNGGSNRPPRIVEGTMLNDLAESNGHDVARGPPVTLVLVKDGAGLGFSLEGGKDSPLGDKPLVIKKIFTGGAAEKSGQLRAGDELLNVNGIDVVPMSRIEAWKLMKRIPDGNVTITVRHQVENRS